MPLLTALLLDESGRHALHTIQVQRFPKILTLNGAPFLQHDHVESRYHRVSSYSHMFGRVETDRAEAGPNALPGSEPRGGELPRGELLAAEVGELWEVSGRDRDRFVCALDFALRLARDRSDDGREYGLTV